jgi:hypothetical protein
MNILVGRDGFLEMDCSDDDNNELVYQDMIPQQGVGVEETFLDDEYMEYDQYYVVDELSTKKNRNSTTRKQANLEAATSMKLLITGKFVGSLIYR